MQVKEISDWKRFLNKFDAWFIAPRLRGSSYKLYKGRVLATVHIINFIIIFSTQALTLLTPENEIGFIIPTFIALALPFIFKKYGNLNVSGHLLAFGVACILVPMVFKSGGLYSDNLLWLILCPLVAMLFCDKYGVLVWLFGLLVFSSYLFIGQEPSGLRTEHDPTYYLISISLLFTVIVLVVFTFKKGEEDIVETLKRQKVELEFNANAMSKANTELRHISDQLQASNSDLESFAYAASHDLKEPLRMIGSYTQLIQRRLKDSLTPDTQEMMGFVQDGVVRMQQLLDDVLEYSRAGRGKDQLSDIDLEDVLHYIKVTHRIRIEETQAEINIQEGIPSVYARYSEMVQVFQNLIGNSIKFRKADIAPKITIEWRLMPKKMLEIRISDNGIGISKEYHEKVFNLFQRLHYRQDYEGSGIGLSTCKKVVENLGGTIHIESEIGQDTTFILNLPISADAPCLKKALDAIEFQ